MHKRCPTMSRLSLLCTTRGERCSKAILIGKQTKLSKSNGNVFSRDVSRFYETSLKMQYSLQAFVIIYHIDGRIYWTFLNCLSLDCLFHNNKYSKKNLTVKIDQVVFVSSATSSKHRSWIALAKRMLLFSFRIA